MDVKSLTNAIEATRVVSYVNAGCIAILFFDFFDCLDKEIRVIWMKKLNFTKIMYLLTRYSTFWEAGVVIYQLSIPGDWFNACAIAFKLNAFLFVFGLGVGEAIMTLRTYAVWGRNPILKYGLPIFYVAVWAAGFTVTALFLSDLEFAPSPLNPYIGCYATRTNPIIFMSWVLLLFYDAVMFVLMAIPAFKAFRSGGRSRLLTVVYRDGVLYYLYLFVISLVNILVTLLAAPDLILIFSLYVSHFNCKYFETSRS
ncbi:hypothetical protein D9613_008070 [Agrocybe pediades]|uniref:DUF6533 domain-containing protein n=1 Tax=Agrocybe pediades TaxID=84607 RepID=A0A8H4QN12_9AGAR|nr:hypothetical protein D9613_008070 [Agrocybe pediades]